MNESAATEQQSIRRTTLHKQLCRAAQVRSLVSMASMLPAMALGGWLIDNQGNNLLLWLAIAIAFGIPCIVSWVLTIHYCRPKVTCRHCGHSLWECGTGNFKPRRMKIRADATACPGCGVPIL